MIRRVVPILAVLALIAQASFPRPARAQSSDPSKEPPKITIPNGGVPQALTMDGRYVRAAYNNEAYTILGYRLANLSVGEEWLLLEVGIALRDKTKDYTLTRNEVSLDTPDGTRIPLPGIKEYRQANVSALKARERVQRDSINYFPPNAYQACAIQFFPDLDQRAMSYDEVELTNHRACLGRFYFKIPGGVTYGQHWLNVKFADSTLRVPFRILTKDEEKALEKHYKSIKKQVDEAFRPKKAS